MQGKGHILTGRIIVDPDMGLLKSPINRKAIKYWRKQSGVRAMPARSDIDPASLRDVIANMIMLNVEDGGEDYRFRLVGTKMREFLSGDYTGFLLSEVAALQPADRLLENFRTVIETRKPILANTPYVGPKRSIVESEDLNMPLSTDGETVDRIMVVVDFRSRYDDRWM